VVFDGRCRVITILLPNAWAPLPLENVGLNQFQASERLIHASTASEVIIIMGVSIHSPTQLRSMQRDVVYQPVTALVLCKIPLCIGYFNLNTGECRLTSVSMKFSGATWLEMIHDHTEHTSMERTMVVQQTHINYNGAMAMKRVSTVTSRCTPHLAYDQP